MNDESLLLLKMLAEYRDLGLGIKSLLLADKFDEVDFVFAQRADSFRRFFEIDQKALSTGYDCGQVQEFRELWDEICGVDRELTDLFGASLERLSSERKRLNEGMKSLRSYYSKDGYDSFFSSKA